MRRQIPAQSRSHPKTIAIRSAVPAGAIKTDNRPPFNSQEFKEFAEGLGFSHRKITPLWPKANAEAERFMKTLNKAIITAHIEQLNWKQQLYHFLRNYRATPHATTDKAPAELLFGRKMRTKLPEVATTVTDPDLRCLDLLQVDSHNTRKVIRSELEAPSAGAVRSQSDGTRRSRERGKD